MKQIFWDLECYKDYFIGWLLVRDGDKRAEGKFQLGDHEKVARLLLLDDVEWVGFNTSGYDDVMLAWWLSQGAEATHETMKDMNDTLISRDEFDHCPVCLAWLKDNFSTLEYEKFGERRVMRFIRSGSEAAELINHPKRHIVDLYLLGEKQGKLKGAAIVLGVDSLVETPMDFSLPVGDKRPLVDRYCRNDVLVTEKAYDYYGGIIQVRRQFVAEGIAGATNLGSAKLAELYLLMMHEKATGKRITKGDVPEYKSRDPITDLTAPYEYQFTCREFQVFWNMLSKATIHYEPHYLVDVHVEDEDDGVVLKKDAAKPSIFAIGKSYIPRGALVVQGCGLKLKFGGGGLHNDAESGIWKKGNGWKMFDIDVTSYYPSLMIANKFSPRHFPQLWSYLRKLLAERVEAKVAKRLVEADSKKLVLNTSFGKTKDAHSPLNDPKCHYSVTINGQLLLLTLIDMVYESIPGAKVLNVNTDGLCVYFPEEHEEKLMRVIQAWNGYSGCNLEAKEYELFAQSTCNLYCGRYTDGSVKTKGGDFKLKAGALKETFAKSQAVKKAVVEYLLNGVDPAETIAAAQVPELCMSFTYGKKTFPVINGVVEDRAALRYLYAKEGVTLGSVSRSKLDEGKTGSKVDGGRPVMLADVLSETDRSNVDETRYVAQAQVIIMGMLRKAVRGTGADLARNPAKYWNEKDWRNQ